MDHTKSEEREAFSLRLNLETVAAIKEYRDTMARENGIEMSFAAAVRALIRKGLKSPA